MRLREYAEVRASDDIRWCSHLLRDMETPDGLAVFGCEKMGAYLLVQKCEISDLCTQEDWVTCPLNKEGT